MNDLIWSINSDTPDDAIPVLDRLLNDPRFTNLHKELQSIHAAQIRKKALRDFEPPTPDEIIQRLDCDSVVTVEWPASLVLRSFMISRKRLMAGSLTRQIASMRKNERLDEVKIHGNYC
ncbi:hypothetical protein NQ122_30345 [Klebsiella pneumoniae]|nr:hypothetical protein [Klebsiella pneumoniae]